MSNETFAALVNRSLVILRREHTPAWAAMCRALSGQVVLLAVGGETMALAFAPDAVDFVATTAHIDVEFSSGARVLVGLIDGRDSLVDAVLEGRVQLWGTAIALSRFHEGLLAYLAGAVRSPSFPSLLRDFKQWTLAEGNP